MSNIWFTKPPDDEKKNMYKQILPCFIYEIGYILFGLQ